MLFMLFIQLILLKLFKLLFTTSTVACMPVNIVREGIKVRTLLEWADGPSAHSIDGLLSKILDGLDGWIGLDGYPLHCCDY